ncbi:MAG: restriction endonuclease subunit S [Dietzia maris]
MSTPMRFKFVAQNMVEKSDGTFSPYIGLEHVESGTGRLANEPEEKAASDSLIAEADDVLFGKLRPYLAKTFRVRRPLTCSGEFLVLRPRPGFHTRFIEYVTRSQPWLAWADATSYGSKMPRTSWDFMGDLVTHVPPIEQQRVIADFLDRETAKIDALIAKQEQLIASLREDRAATITHAVTKGLDSHGGISSSNHQGPPTHWTQDVPLKRLAEVQTGLTLGRAVPPETTVTLPYLRVANVQVGRVDLTEVTEVEIDRSEVPRYRLRAGDVLMTEGGDIDKLGRGCLWQGKIDPCLHQNHVFAVRCFDNLDARFLVYLLDTAPAREYFTLTAKKTTNLASTNSTTLGRFSFPLPPIAEQETIVDFLDERCSKLDTLIDKSAEIIDTLREYRSALITNAVTGQIDVRSAPLESADGPINELTKEAK